MVELDGLGLDFTLVVLDVGWEEVLERVDEWCVVVVPVIRPLVGDPVVLLPVDPVVLPVGLEARLLELLCVALDAEAPVELPVDCLGFELDGLAMELVVRVVGRPALLRLTTGGMEVTRDG